MRVDGWYGCCRLVCNRWCMCSICFSDLVHFADWSLGCFCPAADRHLIKTSCIKPFRVLLNSFIPLLQPRYNPKIFHNSSKHFTEQLIPFSCAHSFLSDVNARYIRFGSNSARGPPLLKTCRLGPLCTWTYPSPARGTATTKTISALWKNTVQPATTWARWYIFWCKWNAPLMCHQHNSKLIKKRSRSTPALLVIWRNAFKSTEPTWRKCSLQRGAACSHFSEVIK